MRWAHHIKSTSSWAYFLARLGVVGDYVEVFMRFYCVCHLSDLSGLRYHPFWYPQHPPTTIYRGLERFPLDPARGRSKMVLRHFRPHGGPKQFRPYQKLIILEFGISFRSVLRMPKTWCAQPILATVGTWQPRPCSVGACPRRRCFSRMRSEGFRGLGVDYGVFAKSAFGRCCGGAY